MGLTVYNKRLTPKKSIVYDTYWKFASLRQQIFFNRLEGISHPWTVDPILKEYKFTNVYRSTDRVSQYLIRHVIYEGSQHPDEVFFRTLLFKIFNKIQTWEFLKDALGEISWASYNYETYNLLLSTLLDLKKPIYSAAYIMASGGSYFYLSRKHQNHLKLIEKMIFDGLPYQLGGLATMEEGYNHLKDYPTIGEFLAYQFITDINYSTLTDFSEVEFVKAGPGAKDGIVKCFTDLREYSYEDVIKMMNDLQEDEFRRLELTFQTLWGRKLQLIDSQNIFCEVDKYARMAHSEVAGLSKRTRIKQKFKLAEKGNIDFFFPPKWGINHLIGV